MSFSSLIWIHASMHLNKQKNLTHDVENNALIKTKLELTYILGLADKEM